MEAGKDCRPSPPRLPTPPTHPPTRPRPGAGLGQAAGLGVEADTWSLMGEMGPTFRQSQVWGCDSPHSSDPTFLLTPRASPATRFP